ncbi:MAG TPA: NepR family anti-sigma factor [Vineibacter sp.]|nr:NepR family anti-sigma factor [Vineibacter sp.]
MPSDADDAASGGVKRKPPQAAAPESRPFDSWLNRQLHALYDDITREPLPDDLVALIDRHSQQAVDERPDGETSAEPTDTDRRDKT